MKPFHLKNTVAYQGVFLVLWHDYLDRIIAYLKCANTEILFFFFSICIFDFRELGYFLWFDSNHHFNGADEFCSGVSTLSTGATGANEGRGIFNRLIPFYLSLSLFKRLFNCLKFTNMHSTFPPMYRARPSRMLLLFKRSKDLKI